MVEEVESYKFRDVKVESAIATSAARADQVAVDQEWRLYNAKLSRTHVTALNEAPPVGYAFAESSPIPARQGRQDDVGDVTSPRPPGLFERIDVSGNTLTRDKVIP